MTSRETRRARIEELYKVYEEEIETLAGNNVSVNPVFQTGDQF